MQNRNRLTNIENNLVVTEEERKRAGTNQGMELTNYYI